jgi:hypothetical protein
LAGLSCRLTILSWLARGDGSQKYNCARLAYDYGFTPTDGLLVIAVLLSSNGLRLLLWLYELNRLAADSGLTYW